EKERLRQIRIEAEQRDKAAQRRRLMVGYVLAGLIGLVVVAGVVVLATSSGGGGAQGASHVKRCAWGLSTRRLSPAPASTTATTSPVSPAPSTPSAGRACSRCSTFTRIYTTSASRGRGGRTGRCSTTACRPSR